MEFHHQRRVAFADTDAAGVVHFSRILCYVEEAEHACLAELGIPLLGDGGWPRVQLDCNYTAPLRPEDCAEIIVSPQDLGGSSIVWKFEVRCGEALCARGSMKTVRVNAEGKPVPLEDSWRAQLIT